MTEQQCPRPRLGIPALFAAGFVGVVAAGCGAGTAALSGGSSGTNATVETAPTTVAVVTPEDGQNGRVELAIFLGVDETQSLTVESIEFSPRGGDPGTFRDATIASGFPSEIGPGSDLDGAIVKAREGTAFRAAWNSGTDFDALIDDSNGTPDLNFPATAACVVRVTVRNRVTGEVKVATTAEFFVDQSLVQTVAGGGVGDGEEAAQAAMLAPGDVFALSSERLYIADTGNNRVRRLDINGGQARVNTIAGNGFAGIVPGFEPSAGTSMSEPRAIAADERGNVYVAELDDTMGGLVRRYDAETGLLTVLVDDTLLPFDLVEPSGLALLGEELLFISDLAADAVWTLSLTDSPPQLPISAFSLLAVTNVQDPLDVVLDPTVPGDVLVLQDSGAVRSIAADGTLQPVVMGDGAAAPAVGLDAANVSFLGAKSIAAAGDHLYVAYQGAAGASVVAVFRPTNQVVNIVSDARMKNPAGVTFAGNGVLYVVDDGGAGLSGGSEGHLVLAVDAPFDPNQANVRSFAADESSKSPTQTLAAVTTEQLGLEFFFD